MVRALPLTRLRCIFHRSSIHYSIGQMLVNRHFQAELLSGRVLLAPQRKREFVSICAWSPRTIGGKRREHLVLSGQHREKKWKTQGKKGYPCQRELLHLSHLSQ